MASDLRLDLERTGFVGWQSGGGDWDLVLEPLGWAVNWLTNLVIFRGGWTVHVVDEQTGTTIAKHRYATRSAAEADMAHVAAVH